jgi:hypothetical protein
MLARKVERSEWAAVKNRRWDIVNWLEEQYAWNYWTEEGSNRKRKDMAS